MGQFNGAMDEVSQKVQNANTHILRCQNHEHAHSSRSVQGPIQWGNGGNAAEGSKCEHSHAAMPKSRLRVQQTVSSRGSSAGRWRTCQGRFQNANTHILQDQNHEHAHNSRSVQGSVQRGKHVHTAGAKITSKRTAVGQFKGQFNGAMERYTWVRFAGKLTPCHTERT